MHKADLFEAVTKRMGDQLPPRQVKKVIETTLAVMTAAMQRGDRVTVTGFGMFETRNRQARWGTNPNTGERMLIPAYRAPIFSPSRKLREAMNNGNGTEEQAEREAMTEEVVE
jgi:DNA-binding protein HU-beta